MILEIIILYLIFTGVFGHLLYPAPNFPEWVCIWCWLGKLKGVKNNG